MTLTRVELTLQEKLDFLPALGSLALTICYALLTGLWRTERQAKTLFLHIGYAVLRKVIVRFSPAQIQFAVPPSNKIYERYAKISGTQPETVQLDHGALGHWIGDCNATNVLIWVHGGGFSLPANIGYFKFYNQIVRHLERSGKSIAVFSLTYTLAPVATYPTQLRQAVTAVRYILAQPSRDPATVFLGGDSAGGNLVGGVLSHLAHPHPQIEPVIMQGTLGGATMLSPWTLLDAEFPDQTIYDGGDLVAEAVAGPWASGYLGCAQRDNYTDLSHAPIDWYQEFPVASVLITGGGNEILLPVIRDFAQKFQTGFGSVELFVGERECHVAPIYNLYLGDRTETAQGKKVKAWLAERAQ